MIQKSREFNSINIAFIPSVFFLLGFWMSHEARMAIVRAMASRKESSLKPAVLACLSKTRDSFEASKLMKKFKPYVPLEEMSNSALEGLALAPPSRVRGRDIDFAREIFKTSTKTKSVKNFARIMAIHGVPDDPELISLFKESIDSVLQFKLFRKLRSERKELWSIYLSISGKTPHDSTEVTDIMSTILAVNGWLDRVSFVFNRRDPNHLLSPETGARFVRALSHHSSGTDNVELVWRIVEASEGGLSLSGKILEAVAGFYMANNQYKAIIQLLERAGPLNNERLGNQILRRSMSVEQYFQLLGLLKNVVDETSCGRAIDIGIESKSVNRIISVLDIMFQRKQKLNPIQESRIRELVDTHRRREGNSSAEIRRLLTLLDIH
jgi:hypothetical protein